MGALEGGVAGSWVWPGPASASGVLQVVTQQIEAQSRRRDQKRVGGKKSGKNRETLKGTWFRDPKVEEGIVNSEQNVNRRL